MSQRIHLTGASEIPVGTGREFVAGGRIIALFHLDEGFRALDGICPHSGGPLAQGTVRSNVVTCPWHGWQFDMTTGRHCLNAHLCQTSFPVTVDGTEVFVELPE